MSRPDSVVLPLSSVVALCSYAKVVKSRHAHYVRTEGKLKKAHADFEASVSSSSSKRSGGILPVRREKLAKRKAQDSIEHYSTKRTNVLRVFYQSDVELRQKLSKFLWQFSGTFRSYEHAIARTIQQSSGIVVKTLTVEMVKTSRNVYAKRIGGFFDEAGLLHLRTIEKAPFYDDAYVPANYRMKLRGSNRSVEIESIKGKVLRLPPSVFPECFEGKMSPDGRIDLTPTKLKDGSPGRTGLSYYPAKLYGDLFENDPALRKKYQELCREKHRFLTSVLNELVNFDVDEFRKRHSLASKPIPVYVRFFVNLPIQNAAEPNRDAGQAAEGRKDAAPEPQELRSIRRRSVPVLNQSDRMRGADAQRESRVPLEREQAPRPARRRTALMQVSNESKPVQKKVVPSRSIILPSRKLSPGSFGVNSREGFGGQSRAPVSEHSNWTPFSVRSILPWEAEDVEVDESGENAERTPKRSFVSRACLFDRPPTAPPLSSMSSGSTRDINAIWDFPPASDLSSEAEENAISVALAPHARLMPDSPSTALGLLFPLESPEKLEISSDVQELVRIIERSGKQVQLPLPDLNGEEDRTEERMAETGPTGTGVSVGSSADESDDFLFAYGLGAAVLDSAGTGCHSPVLDHSVLDNLAYLNIESDAESEVAQPLPVAHLPDVSIDELPGLPVPLVCEVNPQEESESDEEIEVEEQPRSRRRRTVAEYCLS